MRKSGSPPEASRKRQAIGRSRGGLNTKLVALTGHVGPLARFVLRPGNAAEGKLLEPLLVGVQTSEVIADKAYDSNAIREELASRGIVATIPPKRLRGRKLPHYDAESYRQRHRVENLFADLKQFRGLATRYCKLASTFRSMVGLTGWFVATR